MCGNTIIIFKNNSYRVNTKNKKYVLIDTKSIIVEKIAVVNQIK